VDELFGLDEPGNVADPQQRQQQQPRSAEQPQQQQQQPTGTDARKRVRTTSSSSSSSDSSSSSSSDENGQQGAPDAASRPVRKRLARTARLARFYCHLLRCVEPAKIIEADLQRSGGTLESMEALTSRYKVNLGRPWKLGRY
jgi:hypothetical protein